MIADCYLQFAIAIVCSVKQYNRARTQLFERERESAEEFMVDVL